MTKEISIVDMPFADMKLLAEAIAGSGLFGIKTKEQALVLMSISHAEGRHPALAARDYDIIQNRPAKKAEAMMRDFLSAGGKVEWHALDDTIADATFSHPNGGTVRIVWDMVRAAKAQLADKDMYKKFPRQMLRSRTVSEGVRTVWPMATSGMYVPEEAADIPAPFNGKTIEPEADTIVEPPSSLPPAAVKSPPSRRDAINAEIPLKPTATPRTQHVPVDPLDGELGWTWMQALTLALKKAGSQDEVTRIGGHKRVSDALADPATPDRIKREITAMLAAAFGRFVDDGSAANEPVPDDDEVRIVGEEKLAAG